MYTDPALRALGIGDPVDDADARREARAAAATTRQPPANPGISGEDAAGWLNAGAIRNLAIGGQKRTYNTASAVLPPAVGPRPSWSPGAYGGGGARGMTAGGTMQPATLDVPRPSTYGAVVEPDPLAPQPSTVTQRPIIAPTVTRAGLVPSLALAEASGAVRLPVSLPSTPPAPPTTPAPHPVHAIPAWVSAAAAVALVLLIARGRR
jgi:hypothetical protein